MSKHDENETPDHDDRASVGNAHTGGPSPREDDCAGNGQGGQANSGNGPHIGYDDEDQRIAVEQGSFTITRAPPKAKLTLHDFYAYMPMHKYIFIPSREIWPAASVNSRVAQMPIMVDGVPKLNDKGKPEFMGASTWLDRYRAVEQMTWAPGMPELLEDRLISNGGWIEREGVRCFNLYRPSTMQLGDPRKATPWLRHVLRVFKKDDAKHIIKWLAHRVQRPQEKINHALVLGGPQGIGKDTLLEPVKYAIGAWNFQEISPKEMLGRFNTFAQSVILRISEARDLGEFDRFQFYDRTKSYIAAPPDVLRVDAKHLQEYYVLNVCGVIITTNYKMDGIYLPAGDRRHHVSWSERQQKDFAAEYWNKLWQWYGSGGMGHVAAYLSKLDISQFDPKAPPTKTQAFWAIVDANMAPEDAELADVLDRLEQSKKPQPFLATTIKDITGCAEEPFRSWITDRRNRRAFPHRMEKCGWVPVRYEEGNDGLWVIDGKRQVVYARKSLSYKEQYAAAKKIRDCM
jgi:hypothetical protein